MATIEKKNVGYPLVLMGMYKTSQCNIEKSNEICVLFTWLRPNLTCQKFSPRRLCERGDFFNGRHSLFNKIL